MINKKSFLLLSILLIYIYTCCASKKRNYDNYQFTLSLKQKKLDFVKSIHSEGFTGGGKKDITWSLCNTLHFDKCFSNKAVSIECPPEISFGSYILSDKFEYLHIRIKKQKGWIRYPLPDYIEHKSFLKQFLKVKGNGFLLVSHFKNPDKVFVQYIPLFKYPGISSGPVARYGYIIDLKIRKVKRRIFAIYVGLNFNKDCIVISRRDPFYLEIIDSEGKTIKKIP